MTMKNLSRRIAACGYRLSSTYLPISLIASGLSSAHSLRCEQVYRKTRLRQRKYFQETLEILQGHDSFFTTEIQLVDKQNADCKDEAADSPYIIRCHRVRGVPPHLCTNRFHQFRGGQRTAFLKPHIECKQLGFKLFP